MYLSNEIILYKYLSNLDFTFIETKLDSLIELVRKERTCKRLKKRKLLSVKIVFSEVLVSN